jgi:hypothetical protein
MESSTQAFAMTVVNVPPCFVPGCYPIVGRNDTSAMYGMEGAFPRSTRRETSEKTSGHVRRTDPDTFVVADANGIPLVYVLCRDDLRGIRYAHIHLTSDEARCIANGVARLPEFMMPRKGSYPRGGGDFR